MSLRLGSIAPDFTQDSIILPTLQDPEELKRRFPKGFKAVKPYLRLTPQPNR